MDEDEGQPLTDEEIEVIKDTLVEALGVLALITQVVAWLV